MALLLIQAVLAVFGVKINLGDLGDKLLSIVNIAFGILATVGIVNDPTTKDFNDSDRAMNYDEPN
jgi:phi LC3 family holin